MMIDWKPVSEWCSEPRVGSYVFLALNNKYGSVYDESEVDLNDFKEVTHFAKLNLPSPQIKTGCDSVVTVDGVGIGGRVGFGSRAQYFSFDRDNWKLLKDAVDAAFSEACEG